MQMNGRGKSGRGSREEASVLVQERWGAREGAVEEERWGYWVVSALPVGYPRCTGARPTDGLRASTRAQQRGMCGLSIPASKRTDRWR